MTTTTESQTIRSTDVVREITAVYGWCPVTARQFHNRILDGRVAAVRGPDGKFIVDRSNLPDIAEDLGVITKGAPV
jgi:hypothetical protein